MGKALTLLLLVFSLCAILLWRQAEPEQVAGAASEVTTMGENEPPGIDLDSTVAAENTNPDASRELVSATGVSNDAAVLPLPEEDAYENEDLTEYGLKVQILDKTGAPISGAMLSPIGGAPFLTLQTDRDGFAQIGPLTGAREEGVLVTASGFAEGTYHFRRRLSKMLAGEAYEIELSRACSLAGRILNFDGTPSVGAKVHIETTNFALFETPSGFSCSTGDDGSYYLEGMPADLELAFICTNTKTDSGLLLSQFILAPTANYADYVLQQRGGIFGKVVSADGSPIAGAEITIERLESVGVTREQRMFRRLFPAVAMSTDSDGAFVLNHLVPGAWLVRLKPHKAIKESSSAQSYLGENREVDLLSGQDLELLLWANGGLFISGLAVDNSGVPLSSGGAYASPVNYDYKYQTQVRADLENDGSFRLGPLAEGLWEVDAFGENVSGSPMTGELHAVVAGSGDVLVRCTQPARMEVVVENFSEENNLKVFVFYYGQGSTSMMWPVLDDQGRFSREVKLGLWTAVATSGDGRSAAVTALVGAGEVVEYRLRLAQAGKIEVQFDYPEGRQEEFFARVERNGETLYVGTPEFISDFASFPVGDYRVSLQVNDTVVAEQSFQLLPGETYTVDLHQ